MESLRYSDTSSTRRLVIELNRIGCVKHAKPGEEWTLKSGKKSNLYIDLRTVCHHPQIMDMMATQLAEEIPIAASMASYIIGLPLGGIPIATLIAHKTNTGLLLIRKKPKEHGTGRIIEADFGESERVHPVILVDDVMTTGSTIRETLERFKAEGAPLKVLCVVCVVNRAEGSPSTVPGTNIPLLSLLTLDDFRPQYSDGFAERSKITKNKYARQLFQIMDKKQSNLCFSADVVSGNELLTLFRKVAPYIAMIKVHFDAIPDTQSFIPDLFRIAFQHGVMVLADRKLGDIGSTVRSQLKCHPAVNPYEVAFQMHGCTVHGIAGGAQIEELARLDIAAVVVAEMSNRSPFAADEAFRVRYAELSRDLMREQPSNVMGVVCQSRVNCDAGSGIVYMTPGVHLDLRSDGQDQRYRDCVQAIVVQENDMIIVGRGISMSADPAAAAKRYRNAAWEAYRRRL